MKAIVHYNNIDASPTIVKGKDLRIHLDGPQAYHISEGYKGGEFEQHQILGIFTDVFRIALGGKPKKPKPTAVDTLTIDVDTSKLQACIKETMLELEALVEKGDLVHKEDVADDYLDRNCSPEVLAQYGVTAARAERDQLQKEIVELRLAIEQLAFVPPDVATAAQLLDAELLIFLDQSKKFPGPDANQDIHFSNGIRFAIGKLTGDPVPFAQVPFNPPAKPAPASTMPGPSVPLSEPTLAGDEQANDARPATCTCPPKRNIQTVGHLGKCPNSKYYMDCEAQPVKE